MILCPAAPPQLSWLAVTVGGAGLMVGAKADLRLDRAELCDEEGVSIDTFCTHSFSCLHQQRLSVAPLGPHGSSSRCSSPPAPSPAPSSEQHTGAAHRAMRPSQQIYLDLFRSNLSPFELLFVTMREY